MGQVLSMLFTNIQLTQHHLLKRLFFVQQTSVKFSSPNMNIESSCLSPQSYATLCDPVNCNPPGSSLHGIFQAKILDRVAVFFSRGSSWPRDGTCVSCVSCNGGQILYCGTTWEAPLTSYKLLFQLRFYVPYFSNTFAISQTSLPLCLLLTPLQNHGPILFLFVIFLHFFKLINLRLFQTYQEAAVVQRTLFTQIQRLTFFHIYYIILSCPTLCECLCMFLRIVC